MPRCDPLLGTLVQQHPGKIVATHIYPALVVTPGMYLDGYAWWFRVLRGVFAELGVVRLVSLGSEEAGGRMVWSVAGEGLIPKSNRVGGGNGNTL